MTDLVHYQLPLGVLGNLANSLFVKKQLNTIFDFRYKRAEELFGKWVIIALILNNYDV